MSKPAKKNLEIKSIGTLHGCEDHHFLTLDREYIPALKFLHHFSHTLLFYLTDPQNDDKRPLMGDSPVKERVCKLLHVDEENGVLALEGDLPLTPVTIMDIKPYFPCEDRVREVCLPEKVEKQPAWREERPVSYDPSVKVTRVSPEADGESFPITSLGQVRKIEGRNYILLFDESFSIIQKAVRGYSHLRILWWFDRFDKAIYRKITQSDPPYENAPKTGIFATRSPVRPNPVAVTTVRVIQWDEMNRMIEVSDLDAFDHTPVIGILPYIPSQYRVKESLVPYWLEHWPQWLEDDGKLSVFEELDLKEAEDVRLQAFMEEEAPLDSSPVPPLRELPEVSLLEEILIQGARVNNLKDISCTIPKNRLTVITGVSGSGKSSLAFDTLFAESRRRMMDLMAGAVRSLRDEMDKPDVDRILGLPPAVAIEQRTMGRNPRSTVGTATDCESYLRLLFSKVGTRHCPQCGGAVKPQSPEEIVRLLLRLRAGTALTIQPFNSTESKQEFILPGKEARDNLHPVLSRSVKKALSEGKGAITVTVDKSNSFLFQTTHLCYPCNRIFFDLTPSSFSFNHPESMCPVCKGLGVKLEVDAELIVSRPDLSLLDGASPWWGSLRKFRQKPNANWMRGEILALAEAMEIDLETSWNQLPEDFKKQALYGNDGREVRFIYENTNGRKGEIMRPVEGAYNSIQRLFRENTGNTAARIASTFMREMPCPCCHGERLASEGRGVTVGGMRYPEVVRMTLGELTQWLTHLPQKLSTREREIALPLLKALDKRLQNLIQIGLHYLALDRSLPTLSGGEAQRLKLAGQLGGDMTNMLYILDEPSGGLHPRDHKKLIDMMKALVREGNTVVVVEHDGETMLASDKIIDMGPGAGEHGGLIVAQGTPMEVMAQNDSLTGQYLKELTSIRAGQGINRRRASQWLTLKGARHHNLKNITVSIPLGVLTCVTGVSGSGKSSLIAKTLVPALSVLLGHAQETPPGAFQAIEGFESINEIISISQQPIGRTPRSNPATYTGVFDEIRTLFATTDEAKCRGYKGSKFSFNSKEGQCGECNGEGRKCIPMHFMPDIWIECPACHGKRFNREALEITLEGKTISDILEMSVEEALTFFKGHGRITSILGALANVGLDYVKLGQSALTLSGGEAQRVKLAKELSRMTSGRTLYLLDEPTSGLHATDIRKLLQILRCMTEAGNTVLMIEHHLEVIRQADWVIDLGPEGGQEGGYLVAQGTPEEVAATCGSATGAELRNVFGL